ncbi:MAG: M48 family metalloprotease [Armatimonadota bacterium]
MKRMILPLLVLAMLTTAPRLSADASRETEMGRVAARDLEKTSKFITDPQILGRVERIGQEIAKIANTVPVDAEYGKSDVMGFEYKFKVLDDEDVNAFSLPGGFIYVNKGLLDYVQSDHELAGVLAHEVTHASHHHMAQILHEQSKMDGQIAVLLLAGVLGGIDTNDIANLMIGAELVRVARTNGYGQRAELDADKTAVTYCIKAGYNPVGMLTFLERLAQDHGRTPSVDLGILQTHPSPIIRCRNVQADIKSCGLPINRRAVTNPMCAKVVPVQVDGREVVRVMLDNRAVFDPAPIGDALTSEERARFIAVRINQFLDGEPGIREVTISPDGSTILGDGEPIVTVTPQDCAFTGKPAGEIAEQAAGAIRKAIWMEAIARIY